MILKPSLRGLLAAALCAFGIPAAGQGPLPVAPAEVVPVADPAPAAKPTDKPAADTPPAPAGVTGADVDLKTKWKKGIRFESADKEFSLFVGGRFQLDGVGYALPRGLRENIPGTNPLDDGVTFRRIRLDMGGTLYTNIEYYAQVDFANGLLLSPTARGASGVTNATYPTDMWVTFRELPYVGNVRVGNQKPLYSFEHLTSSRFLNFLERSLGFDAFAENFDNGFMPGITAFDTALDKRATWGVGLFKYTRNPFGWNVGRNEAEVNGRLTALPVYEDDGELLVHVGVGAAHRDLDEAQTRLRSRMDARNSPSALSPLMTDTGLFFGTREQLLIPEFAAVCGPFSAQAEYYMAWVHGAAPAGADGFPLPARGTAFFHTGYVELHYFLTGERREYNRDTAVFTRVVPKSPLAWTRCGFTGCGAWQTAVRYTYMDLNSKGINGGRVHDLTLGLNWFLNPNMKVQWNYFLAHRDAAGDAGDGFINGFATRLAIDF